MRQRQRQTDQVHAGSRRKSSLLGTGSRLTTRASARVQVAILSGRLNALGTKGENMDKSITMKMNGMAKSKTVHVVPKDGSWAVKGEGRSGSVHSTQAEAITAARHMMKDGLSGQFVVLGQSGRIVKSETYRLPKVKTPPRKSRLGKKKIEEAVGSIVLDRLNSYSLLPRA